MEIKVCKNYNQNIKRLLLINDLCVTLYAYAHELFIASTNDSNLEILPNCLQLEIWQATVALQWYFYTASFKSCKWRLPN